MNSGAANWAASPWKRRRKKEGSSLKKNSLTEEKRRVRLQTLVEIDAPLWEAGVRFAESAPGRLAVITSLELAPDALTKGAGTWIGNGEIPGFKDMRYSQ